MNEAFWRQELKQHLPQHAVMAGARVVDALAADLAKIAVQPAVESIEKLHCVLVCIHNTFNDHRRAVQRLTEERSVLASAQTDAAKRTVLKQLIEADGENTDVAGDIAALERWFDGEAIEVRGLIRIQLPAQKWELLTTVATALSRETRADWQAHAVSGSLRTALDAVCHCCLIVLRERTNSWRMRSTSSDLLGALAPHLGSLATRARQELLEQASQSNDEPWVQAAALGAYVALRKHADQDVSEVLRTIALPSDATLAKLPGDHCFVRARAAVLCGSLQLDAIVIDILTRPDPSEHVLIEVVRAATTINTAATRQLIHRIVLGELPDISEKVRLAALIAALPDDLGSSDLKDGLLGDGSTRERAENPIWIELVRAALQYADSVWVVERLIPAILDRRRLLTASYRVHAEMIQKWRPALRKWRVYGEIPDLKEAALALDRWLAVLSDDNQSEAYMAIDAWLRFTPEGSSKRFSGGPFNMMTSAQMLDVMSVAAHNHFDLCAVPRRRRRDSDTYGAYRVYNGPLPQFAWWRLMHELAHPAPDKRQSYSHVTDRQYHGWLIAQSALISEVTATRVPGQRVSGPAYLTWGSHLPMPVTLLSAARCGRIELVTPDGNFTISRLHSGPRARWQAHRSYVKLAELRQQLLGRSREDAIAVYDKALTNAGFDLKRHLSILPAPGIWASLQQYYEQLYAGDVGTLAHLAVVSLSLASMWMTRHLVVRHQIRRDRKRMPLSVGGWGSRGKSGTERLKAGLFHGLGYSLVAKTTGCEAMIIASIPGARPTEIFLFRPYDKATIWEQRFALKLGVGLGAQIFLWECMALRPSFVMLLQQQWMRDDIATITNTYPDHEDIQGPAGRDVADVVAGFIPNSRIAITSEQHMSPVLTDAARKKKTTFVTCRREEWELLPSDLLARFPYHEHPRNIALVVRMAAQLGAPADVALKEMADHVVPDLGVLKEYGPVSYLDRELSFINGMSANERAGHLSNWTRMGLGIFDEWSGLRKRLCVVINNRADRLSRQATFEHIASHDICADMVFVIGTNVESFADGVNEKLRTKLRRELLEQYGEKEKRAEFVEYASMRLRRKPLPPDDALQLLADWMDDADAAKKLVAQCYPSDGASRMPEVREQLLKFGKRLNTAASEMSAAERTELWTREVSWLWMLSEYPDAYDPEIAVTTLMGGLRSRVVPLRNPGLSGDQVLHTVAIAQPENSRIRLLGCQNIKGTGLGFVYRWLSIEYVRQALISLETAGPTEAAETLRLLADKREPGAADLGLLVEGLRALKKTGRLRLFSLQDTADALEEHAEHKRKRCIAMLQHTSSKGAWLQPVIKLTESMFDWWDSRRREKKTKQLYKDLVAHRVGFQRAAIEAKKLVERQKGGWLFGKKG